MHVIGHCLVQGWGIVEVEPPEGAAAAITQLDQSEVSFCIIHVTAQHIAAAAMLPEKGFALLLTQYNV